MEKGLVTVVLPAYRGEQYIAQAIQSVLNQDYPHWELFVIDNGPLDRTSEIARSFPQVEYHSSERAGVALARNQGIQKGRGEYVAFIDQDDVWVSHKLSAQLQFLASNPSLGGAVGFQKICLQPGYSKPHWLKQEFLDQPHIAYIPSTLMVRRDLFARTGLFDPTYVFASDTAWFFKARQKGIKIGEMEEVLVDRRIHEENESNQYLKMHKELMRIIQGSLKERETCG